MLVFCALIYPKIYDHLNRHLRPDTTLGIYLHFVKLCRRILVVLRELKIQLAVGDNTNRRQK